MRVESAMAGQREAARGPVQRRLIWIGSLVLLWALLASLAGAPGGAPRAAASDALAVATTSPAAARSGDPNAAGACQEDDDEEPDETPDERLTRLIRQHMEKLTHANKTRYDGKILELEYNQGLQFEDDAELLIRPKKAGSLLFDPQYIRGKMTNPDNRRETFGCFMALEPGALLLRPHFAGDVRLEVDVQFMLVDNSAHFLTQVHASKRTYLAGDFGVHLVHKDRKLKRYPSKDPFCRKPLRKWLDRGAPSRIVLEYEARSKKATVTKRGARPRSQVLKAALPGGRIGFRWSGVSFTVQRVKVRGVLDRKWAATELRGSGIE